MKVGNAHRGLGGRVVALVRQAGRACGFGPRGGEGAGCGPGWEGMDALEGRQLLDAVAWTGGAGDNLWHSAGNWFDSTTGMNVVPGAADDVTIDVAANPTIQFTAATGSRGVHSLLTREAITFSGGTLAVGTTASVQSAAVVTLSGGTLSGGAWDVTSGTLQATSSGGTLASVAVSGDLLLNVTSARVLVSGTTSFTAARLSASAAVLQMAPGYTLNSLVSVEGAGAGARTIQMAVGGAGTVTFGASAIVRLAAGSGADVNISNNSAATLINNGLISAEAAGRVLNINNSTLTNNGTLQVSAGTMTVSPTNWTNPGVVTAGSGTTLSLAGAWSDAGTLAVTGATLNLDGTFSTGGINFAGFTRSGGTVNLTGVLNNTGATLTLDAGTGSWNLMGGTINNGAVNQSGGSTLVATSSGGTLSSVAVSGDLLLNVTSARMLVSGATSFTAARLSANAAVLQLAPGYTLNSLVLVEGAATGTRTIQVAVGGAGTVTFGASAIVRLTAGSGGGLNISNSSAATLINNGLISAEAAGRTLTINNAVLTNNGTLQVTAGTLNLQPPDWTNAGTISAASGATLSFAGSWSDAGTLTVTGATLNLGGTFSTGGLNFAGFTRSAGTVNLSGTLNNTAATLTLNAGTGSWNLLGGTINGGTVTTAGGSALVATSSGGTLADVTLTGELLLDTTSARVLVSGTTSFTAVRLSANATVLQLAPGYTLNSLVSVEGAAAGTRTIQVAVGGAGTVTFGPSAVVRLAAGSGGDLNISNSSAATLINNGLISAETAGRTLTINNTALTNNGTLQVSAGTMTVNPTTVTNYSAGTNTLTGGTWTVGGGTLTLTGATVRTLGPGTSVSLTSTASIFAAIGGLTANQGTFSLSGGRGFAATPTGGTFSNDGTLFLGAGSTLSISGAFVQSSGGVLGAELGGTGAAQFGRVTATGTATLDGTLAVTLASGYAPAVVDTFDVVTGTPRTGTFATVSFPAAAAHRAFYLVYTGTTARVEHDFAIGVWTGAADGTAWANSGNWARGVLPDATIDAYISVAASPTVTITSGAQAARSLESDELLTVSGGSLTVGQGTLFTATLTVSGGSVVFNGSYTGASLSIGVGAAASFGAGGSVSGTTNNAGTFQVNAGALTLSGPVVQVTGSTLAGGAWIVMGGGSLDIPGAAITTNNATVTLDGAGAGFAALNGLTANGGTLVITNGRGFAAAGLSNSGTLAIGLGSTLMVSGTLANSGSITVQGGSLSATGGGSHTGGLDLSGGAVVVLGGTQTFSGSAGVTGTGSLSNTGTLVRTAGGSTSLAAGITFSNSGTVSVQGGVLTIAGSLAQDAGGTLAGGTWVVADPGTLSIPGSGFTANAASVTLTGPNSVFAALNGLTSNTGSLTISGGRLFTLATLTNSGTLTVGAGSVVTVSGALNNSGTVAPAGGTLDAQGGGASTGHFALSGGGVLRLAGAHTLTAASDVTGDGSLTVAGGSATVSGTVSISGTLGVTAGSAVFGGSVGAGPASIAAGASARFDAGAATGAVSNAGSLTLSPGSTLSVAGAYTQTATGTLMIRASGAGAGGFGRIVATGAANLDGSLVIAGVSGYVPLRGDNLQFITAGSVSGTFSATTVPGVAAGLKDPVLYGPGSVRMFVTSLADANNDGQINVADYLEYLSQYATGGLIADINGDGQVNVADYLAFLSWYSLG